MNEIKLSCRCGQVQGKALKVSGRTGNRCICMCDDCQAYAHFLQGGDTYLDSYGGTEIYQLTPSQIKIESGHENIQCTQLKKKGLFRWYASCCQTPIANTAGLAKIPFCGILFPFIAEDENAKNEAMGPVLVKVWGKFARGKMPVDAHSKAPIGFLFRFMRQIIAGWIAGRARPHPFFSTETGRSIVKPRVLTEDERERAYSFLAESAAKP